MSTKGLEEAIVTKLFESLAGFSFPIWGEIKFMVELICNGVSIIEDVIDMISFYKADDMVKFGTCIGDIMSKFLGGGILLEEEHP
jgi:hypothetical protein